METIANEETYCPECGGPTIYYPQKGATRLNNQTMRVGFKHINGCAVRQFIQDEYPRLFHRIMAERGP